MSLVSALKRNGASGFGYGSTAEAVTEGIDLTGKTVLLTGCTSGIGKETMRVLAQRGAHIIGAARSSERAEAAGRSVGASITAVSCELSEPKSVAACINAVKETGRSLDIVVCNAGIMALPKLQVKYGLDLQFLTNHLGHFILVSGLCEQLSSTGRVVVLSSAAHKGAPKTGIEFDNLDGAKGYSAWRSYGQSKLANLLFARHLATRLAPGQTANALHPGVIKTNLTRHMNPLVNLALAAAGPIGMKSIPQGAATQCYVAAHPAAGAHNGEYFVDCNVARSSRLGADAQLAQRLWTVSEELAAARL